MPKIRSKRIYTRVVIPDTHANLHDEKAISLVCDVLSQIHVDELIILGDFWEIYSLSSHAKDPRKDPALLSYEIELGRVVLEKIIVAAKARRMFFLEGNHENRISRYIRNLAPKLYGSFSTPELLKLPSDMFFLPYGQKQHLKCGKKLVCLHGAYTNRWHTAKHRENFGTSVVYGHTHQVQVSHSKNVYGDVHYGISLGWLGDEPKVAEYINGVPQWDKAFGIFYFRPDDSFFFDVVRVQNDELIFQGKLYQ